MSRVGSRVPQARGLLPAHPGARRAGVGSRAGHESSGLLTAVACVAGALLLYLIATQVLGLDGDGSDGPFGSAPRTERANV
jgi:hypothetical protein